MLWTLTLIYLSYKSWDLTEKNLHGWASIKSFLSDERLATTKQSLKSGLQLLQALISQRQVLFQLLNLIKKTLVLLLIYDKRSAAASARQFLETRRASLLVLTLGYVWGSTLAL